MISIIICSASPERLQKVIENIDRTIGCEHEFVAIDNREKKWPITKVYNYAAERSKYPYLFFVHEDIQFHSHNWGVFIEQKLQEPDCGAIGFAGSAMRFPQYSGWWEHGWPEYGTTYYYQRVNNRTEFRVQNSCLEVPFKRVLVLDGLGFFVRRNVWEKHPFDEELLKGFHCYDIDFTLQLAINKYKNYVCCSNQVLIEHFSFGNYTDDWYSSTIKMHREKWNKFLPLSLPNIQISQKQRRAFEEKVASKFLKDILTTHCPERKSVLREFWKMPFSFNHLKECINYTIYYLKHSK